MNTKVQTAVDRLNKILPLAERQKKLKPEINDIYQMILRSYVESGRTLSRNDIARHTDDINDVINILRSNDMVVFNSDDEPVGAYPFTMEQRDHKINVNNNTVHAMCALDALAISPMFNIDTHIDSKCHLTGTAISIDQSGRDILNKDENTGLHFGIDWDSAADNCCATSLCAEMIFLIDEGVAQAWLVEDKKNREIFTIDEAIDFSSGFFTPLIT